MDFCCYFLPLNCVFIVLVSQVSSAAHLLGYFGGCAPALSENNNYHQNRNWELRPRGAPQNNISGGKKAADTFAYWTLAPIIMKQDKQPLDKAISLEGDPSGGLLDFVGL